MNLRESIYGHVDLIKQWDKIQGRIDSPVVLLSGPKGVGKKLLFDSWAQDYLCQEAFTACGVCFSCKQVSSKDHSFMYIAPLDKKSIGVDEAKEVASFLRLKKDEHEKRVVILSDIQRMTPQAANKMLKFIEELPERTLFIMSVPTIDLVLPTIRSRALHLKAKPLELEEVMLALENKESQMDPAFKPDFLLGLLGLSYLWEVDEEFSPSPYVEFGSDYSEHYKSRDKYKRKDLEAIFLKALCEKRANLKNVLENQNDSEIESYLEEMKFLVQSFKSLGRTDDMQLLWDQKFMNLASY